MEIKESKPKLIESAGSYDSQRGKIYKWTIQMEDGNTGEYGSVTEDCKKFTVGVLVKYEWYHDEKYPKIKPYSEKPQNTNPSKVGFKLEPFEHKAAGFAASYSKDLAVADKIKIEQIATYFEKFYKLIISKKIS